MPVVLRWKGCRFFFYSNEGNPREPLHIHIRKGENVTKVWIEPEICIAESYGFSSGELAELMKVVKQNQGKIERSWNEFFND